MKRLVSNIRNHAVLIGLSVGLQAFTCMGPYVVALSAQSSMLAESYTANVKDNFSTPLVLFWLWFAAIGLIAVGGFWSIESGGRFYFEVSRYPSFSSWLGSKLATVTVISILVYGLVPMVFLMAAYPAHITYVVMMSGFLALYGTHLSLILIGTSMLGARTTYGLLGVLLYHLTNLTFDHLGWPNTIRYFLLAEEASVLTFGVASGAVILALAAMLRYSKPAAMTLRESEL